MGLTNENSVYGTVRNPWDPRRIAGGSSGGSAAAVAAGMCFVAVGADAAGSIRVPSAICGGVGMKASFDLVPTHGDFPLAPSLGHVGPMTRSVGNAAAALDVLAGGTSGGTALAEKAASPLEHLTIGFEESYYFNAIDSRIEQIIRNILEALCARAITQEMVVFLHRPGGQSQLAGPQSHTAARNPILQDVIDHVGADPAGPHTVTSMAGHASVSTRHLGRLFRDELGTTPARWLQQFRLSTAQRLILDGYTVTAAARNSGFGSDESLRRAFDQQLHITPSEYQARFGSSLR